MLTALLAAVLAAVAMVSGAARAVRAAGPAGANPTRPATVAVRVGPTAVSRPIAPGFVGFSFEFRAVREYTGSNPGRINPVLVQLIRNLTPGQSPVLRIGGNSADESWWPLPGVAPSPGIKYTLTKSWLATTRALAVQTGGRYILDLNLKLGSAAEIAAEEHAFRTGIGRKRIEAFEIGNEPELYPITPFYYEGPGRTPVYPRPTTYDFSAYAQEMSQFAKPLRGTALAGPVTGSFLWLAQLRNLLAAEPGLKMITYHRYPLIKCFTKPGDPGYPSIPNLLSPDAARDLLQFTGGYIGLAHRNHASFRVDELNSVACKGQAGVSDTFASALWMLDTLFAMARSGVDGVNIHSLPEAVYHPFSFQWSRGRWVGSVSPEYYGLLLFTEAAPPGSRLLSTSVAANSDIRARATLTPGGLTHVVLMNDSLTSGGVVRLPAPPGVGKTAILERLRAPGAAATGAVTLGGQTFGAQTTTGTLTGKFQAVHLTPVHGHYLIQMPASSAAMVSFAPAPPKKS
jgi:Glycosyl hydrolase family 79 C-terminal beta domain